jgi:hypothetical protein
MPRRSLEEEKAVHLEREASHLSPRFRDIYSPFGGFAVGSLQLASRDVR